MYDDDRTFRHARDAGELALGSAFASIEDAKEQLDRLASAVNDRSEVDALRGAAELVTYAIEGLAVAVAHIAPDGSRRR